MSDMARRTFQVVACLLFGFLPLTFVVHAIDAASLPSSLISHFDSSGTPAAWITKSGNRYRVLVLRKERVFGFFEDSHRYFYSHPSSDRSG
jgi:uncharacterized membrane protein